MQITILAKYNSVSEFLVTVHMYVYMVRVAVVIVAPLEAHVLLRGSAASHQSTCLQATVEQRRQWFCRREPLRKWSTVW